MSAGLRRGLADLTCRALQAILPPSLQSWGWAIRCETANIPDDTKALLFAIQGLCGLMPRAIASHLLQPFASLFGEGTPLPGGSTTMSIVQATMCRPRTIGIACAIAAVALGIVYLAIAGAPMRYLGVNAGALVIGLTMLALLGGSPAADQRWMGAAIVAAAGTLLATAFLGADVDGAARWVRLGGLAVQPSLILVPVMLVAFSRCHDVLATAGIVAAAAAMALQPDRAMAGMLALCLAARAITDRDRHAIAALAAGVASFAATLARADTLPATPYVDQILYSSFQVHGGAGLAVWGGLALLLLPAVIGWRRDAENRATYVAFGMVWLAAMLAAGLGNYPTPIVGYGGSAIIGYALSLLALPKLASAGASAVSRTPDATDSTQRDRTLRVGLA
ncbi:hypothetical protein [Sphingomonas dokdonensis]|uniref:Uncharacterized protein n=1 Tax=Sphingomonas dokdonensis TaxID=344880 RepID=A0A245ZMQ9_9SPHN|nr:hypothetical protein [Sphingomonas dokdonensis]OWK31022.1 hypothetical protein SPDO_10270 [Sphingomonas dokdonensis]